MGGGVAKLSPRRQVFMNNYHAPEPATRAPSTYGWCQVSDWGEMPRRLSNTPRSPRARATDEVGHASSRAGEHVGACTASEHIARFQDATCTASMLQEHLRETKDELPKKPESGLFFKCLEQRLDAVGREIERKEHKLREERRQYERSCCSSSLLSLVIFGTVCRFLAHLGSRDKRIYFLLFLTAICALFKFSTNLTQARVGKAGCSKIYSNSRRVATALLLKIESTHCHCTWNSSSAHWPQVDCNSLTASARVAALALDVLGWAGPSRLPVADEVDPRRHAPWAAPRPK